jgi:hypothetical protein
MKSIKHFSMFLFAGILSLTMFSCISDDDKNQEITRAHYSQLSGSYSGTAQYFKVVDNATKVEKAEGVSTVITSDSTMKVMGLPIEGLVKKLDSEEIKNALLAQPCPEFSARYVIYNVSSENEISFWIYPTALEFNNVELGGTTHNYKILFAYPSGGTNYKTSSIVGFYLYPAELYDGDVKIQSLIPSLDNVTDYDAIYVECSK